MAYDGESNPSTRLRILQYIPTLVRAGLEVSTLFVDRREDPAVFGRRLDEALVGADVVFVQRVVTKEVISRLSRSPLPVIFDLDDAVYYIRQSQYPSAAKPVSVADWATNAYRWIARGSRYYSSRKRLLDQMLDLAVTTIVGNSWLFEELRLSEERAIVLPTSVWLDGVPTKKHEQHRPLTIGWIGVKGNLYYLDAVHDAFEVLQERYSGGVELTIVSSEPARTPLPTRFRPWSLDSEGSSVLSFDIGIMPLQDDPFSRGKSAFKAVLCMSRGIPVVASPVGANTALIEHGVNGWLAASTDEWVEGISALTDDVSLRAHMGHMARTTIEESYSADRVAKILLDLVQRATRRANDAAGAPIHERPHD